MSTIRSNHKCSKVVGISSDIFGNIRKSSEVAQTFSEIPVMTRQKSHTFDSERVGRYISVPSLSSTALIHVPPKTFLIL